MEILPDWDGRGVKGGRGRDVNIIRPDTLARIIGGAVVVDGKIDGKFFPEAAVAGRIMETGSKSGGGSRLI